MIHRPKTVVGNVIAVVIALIAGSALVQAAIAVSGTFVWLFLAVAALAAVVGIVVHRQAQVASDLALADAPSFADVLPQWNSRRDLAAARLVRPGVNHPATVPAADAGDGTETDTVEQA